MPAGKTRPLSVRVAYLRLASEDCGIGLNVKWTRKLTPFMLRMVHEGELVLRRLGSDGRGHKAVTTAYATELGKARLAAALAKHGPDFGPTSEIDRDQPSRLPKTMRRKRIADADPRRIRAERERRRIIDERVLKFRAEWTPPSTRKARRAAQA